MSLPNRITIARIAMAAVGAVCLLSTQLPHRMLIAGALFALCAASDWLDGALARRTNVVSPLGTFLDPLADKIAVMLYFLYLTSVGVFPLWLLMAMLVRDLLQDAYRNFAASQRVVLGANLLSKTKTALQFLAIFSGLLAVGLAETTTAISVVSAGLLVANGTMLLALGIGVAGTVQFMRSHASILASGE